MRYYDVVFLFIISFLFVGCFEVLEEITLNDDGSGHITMTVNISQSKTKLKSVMLMDSINNYKVPSQSDIRTNIEKMTAEVKKIDGVSNVSHTINFDDFIFSVSCDFVSVDVLNKVITHFGSEGRVHQPMDINQFSYSPKTKTFKRSYNVNLSKEISKVNTKDREILDGASITTIYRFESEIASSANSDARIAGSNKAIMLKVGAQDMISDKKNIKNTIVLK